MRGVPGAGERQPAPDDLHVSPIEWKNIVLYGGRSTPFRLDPVYPLKVSVWGEWAILPLASTDTRQL